MIANQKQEKVFVVKLDKYGFITDSRLLRFINKRVLLERIFTKKSDKFNGKKV